MWLFDMKWVTNPDRTRTLEHAITSDFTPLGSYNEPCYRSVLHCISSSKHDVLLITFLPILERSRLASRPLTPRESAGIHRTQASYSQHSQEDLLIYICPAIFSYSIIG